MKNEKMKAIINEIVEKAKNFKDGFISPEEYNLKVAELENFDSILFTELENTKRMLWERKSNCIDNKEIFTVPILKIKNDIVTFYPQIIREYQKEINL